ncbi:hypothetical protein HOLleu_20363 [Holothuria leucospilota]|uniref:Uncharacterized protein n=1 Tax=Holothuria leucospilota TaxID=206669 RepID=A0A9Q1H5N2_HOLLE|nr:hypothetical protein HOLleu_20363 [Holothuria leucospilota]
MTQTSLKRSVKTSFIVCFPLSMMKESNAGVSEGDVVAVTCFNDIQISGGTSRTCNKLHATLWKKQGYRTFGCWRSHLQ